MGTIIYWGYIGEGKRIWKLQQGMYRGYMGACQTYGPFLDPYNNAAPNIYLRYPKRDHNFDKHPREVLWMGVAEQVRHDNIC